MLKKIDLSIIITSVNTRDLLASCLDSIKPAILTLKTEVIVVDSGSSDGTVRMIKNNYPWVKLIEKRSIKNFGENNNSGIKIANGKYILFLNSDTLIIDKNIFNEMILYLDQNPKIGLAGCALINVDRKTYQGSGGSFPNLFKIFAWMFFLDDIPYFDNLIKPYHPMHEMSPLGKNEIYYKTAHQQDWITGAFYLVRKDILDKIGGFDEDFSAYVEEVDLSYRIKKSGYEVWYLPKWKIIHFGGMSYGNENSIILEMKNLKLFYMKHFPKWQLPVFNIIIKVGCLLRIIVFSFFRPDYVKIYAKAIKSF